MANIKYILSKRIDDEGMSEIYMRYPLSRTKYIQLNTDIKVKQDWFSIESYSGNCHIGHIEIPKRGRLNNMAVREAEQARADLQDYEMRFAKVMKLADEVIRGSAKTVKMAIDGTMGKMVADITVEDISMAINRKGEAIETKTISDWMDKYLEEKKFPRIHHNHLLGVIRIIHRWEAYRQDILNEAWKVDIDTISSGDIEDLRNYILNEVDLQQRHKKWYERIMNTYPAEISTKHKKSVIKARGANAVIKLMSLLHAFWNWMLKRKITANDPFKNVEIGTAKYGVPYYLSIEERNQMADYDLSARPQLAIQRDIFVFQCLIGCRVGDLYKMTASNITNGILEYVPHKTQDGEEPVKPRVPLNERALKLIEKYKGQDKKGRLFPFISVQRYNDDIKEVLKACGITRNVIIRNALTGESEIVPICDVASSHMARRTFVGNAYKKVKDPNLVGKMSGHVEGSRAFTRYRAIDDEMLKEVIDMIE